MYGTAPEPNRWLLRGTIIARLRRVNQRPVRPQQEQAFDGKCGYQQRVHSPTPSKFEQAHGGALFPLVRRITSSGFHSVAGYGLILQQVPRRIEPVDGLCFG